MTRFEEPNLNIDDSPTDLEKINTYEKRIHIPNLFWAALLIFSVNLMIVIWFYFSPGFTVRLGAFHPEQTSVIAESKPSVFTELVDESRKPVKTAMKARPVLYDLPVVNTQLQLDLPVRTVPAAHELAIPRTTERSMPRATTPAMPRKSDPAALDIPRATESQMRHATTIEVRPKTEPPKLLQ
jgi:hypothetical protein